MCTTSLFDRAIYLWIGTASLSVVSAARTGRAIVAGKPALNPSLWRTPASAGSLSRSKPLRGADEPEPAEIDPFTVLSLQVGARLPFSLPEETSKLNYTRLATLDGSQVSILVPLVVRELISRCPPSDRSRSSMLRIPMPDSAEGLFGSKPLPRSETDRWRLSPDHSSRTSALFAPLCLLKLRSAS